MNRPPPPTSIVCCVPTATSLTVALIHCETSTGILNPLTEIAQVVAQHGKRLIIDAMSSFGALPVDAQKIPFDALIAASGKCLEGVPGMGFVFARKESLAAAVGNSHSLAMDLFDQHSYMMKTGQWRLHPAHPRGRGAARSPAAIQRRRWPAGASCALRGQLPGADGGDGPGLGLSSFLPAAIQAPIIATFHAPKDPRYQFKEFYERVQGQGLHPLTPAN
jgi:2-aminoethylphosphonate-pyruvate transaminase